MNFNHLRHTLDGPILVKTTTGMTPTIRTEAPIIPIRKARLETELIVSNIPEFEPHAAQYQFTITTTDYNELIGCLHS
ncbi:MAG: hypothetical protein OEX82_00980 [Nitrosomonas sp.]|nr:hypothetical protein [Nitrosomonas sp.]